MRRSKAEVERYIASVQSSAPSHREKSMKGFFFAKLYYEAKEYELAKRYISSYLDVQERDPKALKFLGHLYEVEGLVDKAVGCYKSSVELNPTQKDLVLKIAELLCDKNVDDGRAEYWVERASKLFPGSPAVYKLKEKLLNFKGDVGWNQLFDLIQSELYTRPDDVYVNIRLVELYRTNKRMEEAVNHCLNAEKKGALRTSLEWCTCVVHILKEYLKSFQGTGPDKSMWRLLNKELLLAHCNLMLLSLSSKDVQECRKVFQSFDQTLQAVKQYATGTDDLSIMFLEMRGQFYMLAGTLLLKMAQNSEAQWRAVTEPAALCYLIAFQVPKPKMKSIKGSENGQDVLEMLACDRRSQSGHMLCNLSLNKEGFLKGVVETFANKSGQSVLFDVFFEKKMAMEQSFLGSDDIRDIDSTKPKIAELARYDHGSICLHNGNLHHLAWLGLQYPMSSPPEIRKWLKQLFPRLPQETPRLNTNAPESVCILDLEIFLLGVIFTSNLELQNHFNIHYHPNQPKCLPLPVCTSLGTERQRSWWDAVYNLIHKKTQPGASAKLRLLFQHELITLRALEKHGLQPAIIIHWARNLHKTGSNMNSYYDQKDYMVRCVHYWKKILPLLDCIRQKKNIPEPIDPLFKHFHSQDIQIHEVSKYEEEARIAFASLDVVDGRFDDAIRTFDEIKNVVSYWNLARIFQRKAEDIENDAISAEEQEECTNCLQKSKLYLSKIIDESFADSSVAEKLPVSLETVKKMLDSVLKELGEYCGEDNSVFKGEASQIDEEIKLSTQTPTRFSISPNKSYKLSPKTPPSWVEDQRALLQMLCHQVEVLNNEVRELKLSYSGNTHTDRWHSECFGPELMPNGYQGTPSFHETPLTVSTTGAAGYYNQAPAYSSKYLLRTATSDTPAKAPLYGDNQLASQPHMYAYQQPIPTPPVQNITSKFPRETFGASVHYGSPGPGLLSPRVEDYYSYSFPKTTANPPLPEPGYFTKPALVSQGLDSNIEELGKVHLSQTPQTDSLKIPPFINSSQDTSSAFKFTSNFQSNEGGFAFSTPQFVPPNTAFSGSESLFSLLTSDTLCQGSHTGQKASADSQESKQKNVFNFGQKHCSGLSLKENESQNLDKTHPVFDKGYPTFNLKDAKTLVFETPTADAANVSHESNGSALEASDDDGPHFEPVVPLPDKVEVKTGEEEEEELFSNRAKLFRFDTDLKEWKERGVGIVKILRHKKSGKVRLLMRREQVLKICANHYISPNMTLKLNAGSNKSYVWHALDYADEMPKPEQLAIRFKTQGEAQLFKQKFEEAQKHLKESLTVGSPPQQSAKASHQSVNKGKGTDKYSSAGATFGKQSIGKLDEWNCDGCMVRNNATAPVCVTCQAPPPSMTNKVKMVSVKDSKTSTAVAPCVTELPTFSFGKIAVDPSSAAGFGGQYSKKQGEWDCDVCLLRNAATTSICVACQSSLRHAGAEVVATLPTSSSSFATSASVNLPQSFNFSKEPSAPVSGTSSRSRKKKGPWVCRSCSVTNEAGAKICGTCRTIVNTGVPGSDLQVSVDTVVLGDNSSSLKSDFGARFSLKEGQWDCNVCLVRNEASSVSCVSCLTPNPQATPTPTVTLPPAPSFKFGSSTESSSITPSSFGSQFSKRNGQWDCNVCLVRNEASSVSCASCLTPNPQATPTIAVTFPPGSSFKFGSSIELTTIKPSSFGSQFSKKEGQWDCNVCLVRNEASSLRCVSCLAFDPKITPSDTTVAFPSAPSFKFGSSTESSTLKLTGFGSQFSKTEGQWDCTVCFVRNKPTVTNCSACQAPNQSSALTFGLKNVIFEPKAAQSETLSNSAFTVSNFQFGLSEKEKIPSSTFQMPSFNSTSNPVNKGFAFSVPVPSGGFKFGIPDLPKNDQHNGQSKERTTTFQNIPGIEVNQKPSESAIFASRAGSIKPNDIDFGKKMTTFTFADLATPSESQIEKKVSNFKDISQSNTPVGGEANTTSEHEKGDELYQTEDCDNIHFEPVVQLPEKVDLVTGEEGEEVLYSERVKLFRFDADISQWKERGVGSLKILRNEMTGALRLLMRRDQVLKVCANHWITNSIKLKPLSGSDRAWMWLASDFSDGDVKLEQLAAKFKNSDQAQDFKSKFEESQKLLIDQSLQTCGIPSKPDSSKKVNKEGKSAVGDLITEQQVKHHEKDTEKATSVINSPSIEVKTVSECSKSKNDNLGKKTLQVSLANTVSLSPVAFNSVKKSPFSFGDAAAGFNFNFQPVLSPSKSPTKLNHSRVSVGTDEESDITQEEDRDGPYFEPVIPLPDLVEVSSGEENEQVLFRNRAKLYRFDKEANQWKERGIGDMKILQNYGTKTVRVIMRRDQVLKICANHRITSDINLKPMAGMDRAWIWTAIDFAEGEGKAELFAVRFKLQDVADSFHQTFVEAKQAQENGTLLSPLPLAGSPLEATLCGKMAVAVLEETTRERTDLNQEDSTTVVSPVKSEALDMSEKPTKNFLSPPKLVFGSDSVKNIFSSEEPKSFTFGSTSTAGSLFGFSFNPMKSGGEKNSSVTHNITAKRLDFDKEAESSKASIISHKNTPINPLKSSTPEASTEKEIFKMLMKDENRKGEDTQFLSDDVVFVYELSPTPEQRALAESLQLPPTFFCYKSRSHYESDDDQDDEDFETAVKKLNGQLYPEYSASGVSSNNQLKGADEQTDASKELVSESLKSLHLSSFGVTPKDTSSQDLPVTAHAFEESRQEEVSSSTNTTYPCKFKAPKPTISFKEEEDSNIEHLQTFLGSNNAPEALSTKFQNPDSTFRGLENFDQFGFSSSTGQSFADLALSNSGKFAFGNTDKNFTWQSAGAVLFSSEAASKTGENEDDDGEEAAQNEDVHFEPIVSLVEVEVKSGEEDEEVLFKERAKLYRWDRDVTQWKERGEGEIKILFHPEKKFYRVLMRRDQIFKVCANHVLSTSMDIQPLASSNNALVWTAMDYSDGEGRAEQFAVRFKTQEMADSFKKTFQECQQNLPAVRDAS